MKSSKWIWLPLLIGISGCEEVLERSLAGKEVVLQTPGNNLSTKDQLLAFSWQEMEGAQQYQLQVCTPRFDSATILVADTTISTVVFKMNLEKGNYQWRVRAKNTSTASNYGAAWNLTIQ